MYSTFEYQYKSKHNKKDWIFIIETSKYIFSFILVQLLVSFLNVIHYQPMRALTAKTSPCLPGNECLC